MATLSPLEVRIYSLQYADVWLLSCPTKVLGAQFVAYCQQGILILADQPIPDEVLTWALGQIEPKVVSPDIITESVKT